MITFLHRSDQGGCQWKRKIGAGLPSGRHDGGPLRVERADKFIGGFDEILCNTAMGKEVNQRPLLFLAPDHSLSLSFQFFCKLPDREDRDVPVSLKV